MMQSNFFWKNSIPVAFSPLQIAEGLADGLLELTPQELEAHLTPAKVLSVESVKDAITAKRWQIETGGLTLPNGVHVATGIDDQNRITSVITNAELAGVEVVDFKAASGWVSVTVAELKAVAAAIALHVQRCFTAERAHHEAIDALEQLHADDTQALQQALETYDLEQGWPATDLREPQPA